MRTYVGIQFSGRSLRVCAKQVQGLFRNQSPQPAFARRSREICVGLLAENRCSEAHAFITTSGSIMSIRDAEGIGMQLVT